MESKKVVDDGELPRLFINHYLIEDDGFGIKDWQC